MKVMVIVKASVSSETGIMPDVELLEAMGAFNEKLVKAGVMESGDGLKPSSEGLRVRFEGQDRLVTHGPFAETNELIAGYWVWNVSSMDEALEWVKQCPNPMPDASDIEIRPFYEFDDLAEIPGSEEALAKEDQLRHTLGMQSASVNTYLFFAGRCEEALEYYATHLGAKIGMLMRFNEAPDPIPEGVLPPGFENKVMHGEVTIGNTRLLVSDGCVPTGNFSGFSQAITVTSKETATQVFNALSDGGEVTMPLQETFWSPLYGQVKDKFGLDWMVMVAGPTPGETE